MLASLSTFALLLRVSGRAFSDPRLELDGGERGDDVLLMQHSIDNVDLLSPSLRLEPIYPVFDMAAIRPPGYRKVTHYKFPGYPGEVPALELVAETMRGGEFPHGRVCHGMITQDPSMRMRALAEPMQCLRDKLGDAFAKLCQECAIVDGVYSAQMNRSVLAAALGRAMPCTKRYLAASSIYKGILAGDPQVIVALRAGADILKSSMQRFGHRYRIFSEVPKYGPTFVSSITEGGAEAYADTNSDGIVSASEAVAFLQASYEWADTVQEVVIMGNYTAEELDRFTTIEMAKFIGILLPARPRKFPFWR